MFESILCQVTEYDPDVLEPLIGLVVEIAREGREGRRVGTLFTLGDEDAVLARSRPLILDPSIAILWSARKAGRWCFPLNTPASGPLRAFARERNRLGRLRQS
jgi:hypothetical protein